MSFKLVFFVTAVRSVTAERSIADQRGEDPVVALVGSAPNDESQRTMWELVAETLVSSHVTTHIGRGSEPRQGDSVFIKKYQSIEKTGKKVKLFYGPMPYKDNLPQNRSAFFDWCMTNFDAAKKPAKWEALFQDVEFDASPMEKNYDGCNCLNNCNFNMALFDGADAVIAMPAKKRTMDQIVSAQQNFGGNFLDLTDATATSLGTKLNDFLQQVMNRKNSGTAFTFTKYDKNKSGQLEKDELDSLRQDLKSSLSVNIDVAISAADKNGDGVLDGGEFGELKDFLVHVGVKIDI